MLRSSALLVLVAACNSPGPRAVDPKLDAPTRDAELIIVDSPPPPPPSVDAGPPPVVACGVDAGMCELPPSQCLDTNYLYYYDTATCQTGTCAFTTKTLYCDYGCVTDQNQGYCRPGGFT